MVKNRITAAEARKITEESNFLLKSAYRWIEDAAKQNLYYIPLGCQNMDPKARQKVLDILVEDGYTIKEVTYSDENVPNYEIYW